VLLLVYKTSQYEEVKAELAASLYIISTVQHAMTIIIETRYLF